MGKTISFLLVTILFSMACGKSNTAPQAAVQLTPVDTAIKTFLALGDSYTIGQSVPENDRFPNFTARFLQNDGIQCAAPEIIAQTGWTTGNLLARLSSNPPQRSYYDIVTLLIGVNNQYQGRSQSEYRTELTNLLQKALAYSGNSSKRVTVLSIPDWGVTPFASGLDRQRIALQIDSFNLINRQVSGQFGVNYIDITPISRLAAGNTSLLASDNLHPSGLMYSKWAEQLAPVVKAGLR